MASLRPKTGPACGRPAPQGARVTRLTVLDPKTGLSVIIEVRPRDAVPTVRGRTPGGADLF